MNFTRNSQAFMQYILLPGFLRSKCFPHQISQPSSRLDFAHHIRHAHVQRGEPETRNLKSKTLNPNPQTLNHKP